MFLFLYITFPLMTKCKIIITVEKTLPLLKMITILDFTEFAEHVPPTRQPALYSS